MKVDSQGSKPVFCDDSVLGYQRSRTSFAPGKPFLLDAQYRLAHLPLVNPDHPDVIPSVAGKDYAMGVHPPVHSLVLPVPQQKLDASPAYQTLVTHLRESSFAAKIAWDCVDRRRGMLHATLCGSLGQGASPPLLSVDIERQLQDLGPFNVRVQGLFSGNVNVGRLYLKAYPEKRNGQSVFQALQKIMDRPLTDLHVIGVFNLTDHLSAHEATDLAKLIDTWWDQSILDFTADHLWLLTSSDDLVLSSRVAQHLSLGAMVTRGQIERNDP